MYIPGGWSVHLSVHLGANDSFVFPRTTSLERKENTLTVCS